MRQKKILLYVVTMALLMAAMVENVVNVKAANTQDANRMNVVFVMDESGSMRQTDRAELRYDAMDLFMGLATDTGNYMGAVSFDTNIILKQDIAQIDGIESKDALSRSVRDSGSNGDTDIGKAIETATQMLQEQGNPALPSAIILLSDGNTDLKSDTAYQESITSKNNAINIARENDYKIYSVCLNSNGKADPAELREISEATGAISMEVQNAEDLKEVFNQFYDIIYSTETVVLGDVVIPDSGETEIPFSIPRIGVEEANIIISTLNSNTSYNLTQPNGITYTSEEMDAIRISIDTFAIFKLKSPEPGEWKLIVRGIPGDNVKIEMVYNANLTLDLDINSGNLDCAADEDIPVVAKLLDGGTVISDGTIYQDYPIYFVLANTVNGTTQENKMNREQDCASYSFRVGTNEEYDIYAYCEIDSMHVTSETYHISVSNTRPTCTENPIKVTKLVWPFTKESYLLDLTKYFADTEDTTLAYSISKSDFDKSVVSVDDTNLDIHIKEVDKGGELYVTARDSSGAVVETQVIIKTTAMMPILLLILAVVVAIVIVLIVRKKVADGNKPIRGRVMIVPYTDEGTMTPNTYDGTKGKMFIGRCMNIRENIGVDMRNTCFVAGEKDSYIYLVSKNGYYTDRDPDRKDKRIRLDSEMEVDISSDIDFEKGMKVTYISDDMDY